ncbi:MAG TPA: 3-phosphoshikimate 1-carboxyvinyltransferase [Methanocorpusculum sp.]|nr:3-phosphoshikimate 1-carboxyvinyltransferase [Methanocorpusculum sp.]
MMEIKQGALSGTIRAPPSKSAAIREYILSARAPEKSVISNPLYCEDTNAVLNALEAFGASVEKNKETLVISGGYLHAAPQIDCKNSATAMRFLAALAADFSNTTEFCGDESLCRRPIQPLLSALENAGANITSENGHAPFSVTGPTAGADMYISGDISSQFISALLISAPENGRCIHVSGEPVSAPYIDMTISALKNHGVSVEKTADGWEIPPGASVRSCDITLPGDYSNAAYFLAGGALLGDVTVENLPRRTTQGDKIIVDILKEFGADVFVQEHSVRVRKAGLKGTDVNIRDAPDLFPILCVIASQAEGTSRIYGAPHLKDKESNRIETTVSFLKNMGADITALPDGAVIKGKSNLLGSTIYTHNDHRIAMSAIIAGLCAKGVTTIDCDCTAVSYPDFLLDLARLKK